VLGPTGRNFAAGMSGGLAFVLDEDGAFRRRINPVMLDQIETLDEGDAIEVRDLIDEHVRRTGSPVGQRVLDEWDALLAKFVKVFPTDYKRVLAELAAAEAETAGEALVPRNDHPHSTGGEGFVTTEGELDEPVAPAADTGASGDAARDGRIAPEPGEVRADG
jgi:GXGXG motif-containing protein